MMDSGSSRELEPLLDLSMQSRSHVELLSTVESEIERENRLIGIGTRATLPHSAPTLGVRGLLITRSKLKDCGDGFITGCSMLRDGSQDCQGPVKNQV
jgi:hypothetical protein